MASLGYVPGLAAGRATVSRSCADLRGIAVHYLVTGAAGADTFFAAVLPKPDTLEAADEVTVVVGAAQAVIAACGNDLVPAGFADRGGGRDAVGVDAGIASEIPDALLGPVVIDVGAERASCRETAAVRVLVAGPVRAGAITGNRRGRADVALWTVEGAVAGHAAIHASADFTGEPRRAIVSLGG